MIGFFLFKVSLRLPASYPLRTVDVSGGKKIGVKEAQWRQWILSMHTLLLTQVGVFAFVFFQEIFFVYSTDFDFLGC
jgi:hypothetical protein